MTFDVTGHALKHLSSIGELSASTATSGTMYICKVSGVTTNINIHK